MLNMVREIRDGGDVNLVISSHLLHDIEECFEEVLILKDGRIAALCNLEEERKANLKFLELEIGEENGFVEAVAGLGCECARFSGGRVENVMPAANEVRER